MLTPLLEAPKDSDDALQVEDAFPSLQEARHEADYDHRADFSRPRTLNHVEDARAAVEAVGRDPADAGLAAFRTLVVIRPQGR